MKEINEQNLNELRSLLKFIFQKDKLKVMEGIMDNSIFSLESNTTTMNLQYYINMKGYQKFHILHVGVDIQTFVEISDSLDYYEGLILKKIKLFTRDIRSEIIERVVIEVDSRAVTNWSLYEGTNGKIDLINKINQLKKVMILVATGTTISTHEKDYNKLYYELKVELAKIGLRNPNEFQDLWQWYNRWKLNDLETYQSRRIYIAEMYKDTIKIIEEAIEKSSKEEDVELSLDEFIAVDNMVSEDKDFNNQISSDKEVVNMDKSKVFIVHGRNNEAKLEVARTIEKLGLEAIILHEQVSSSRTIIQKLEDYTDVGFAIIIYTPCDLGSLKGEEKKLKSRARQNVVFEHGYLMAKIGRYNVCALCKEGVESPNDVSGIVYTPMDDNGGWKLTLAKELKESGYSIDMNKL